MLPVNSLVFHPKTKRKIAAHWETLSPGAKKLILRLEKDAENYQTQALTKAHKGSPEIFNEALTHKVAHCKGDALERVENIEDDIALAEIDKTLSEL